MAEWVMIKNIGRFTCRNASVVDYCITSPELLKLFFDFEFLYKKLTIDYQTYF
jgi:hypothetical protein